MIDVSVKIEQTQGSEGVVVARVPFHPDFVETAHVAGGVFSGDAWSFKARHEMRVRKLCFEVFGTDGRIVDTCDVRINLTAHLSSLAQITPAVYFAGKLVASRRISGAIDLGDSVVIVSGHFRKSIGRSATNIPTPLDPSFGMVVEVRDVPLSLAVREQFLLPGVSIVTGSLRMAGPGVAAEKAAPVVDLAQVPVIALVGQIVERWAEKYTTLCALLVAAREPEHAAAAIGGVISVVEGEAAASGDVDSAEAVAAVWRSIEGRAVDQARAKGPHTAEDIDF